MEQSKSETGPGVRSATLRDGRQAVTEKRSTFEELWGTYGAELYRRCLGWMSGRPEDAEEAFSRAGVLAFRKYPSYRTELTDPHRWFVRLTYNVCMDLHREIKRERACQVLDSEVVEAAPTPVQSADFANPERRALRAELERHVLRSVRALSPTLREVVEPVLLEGSSYQEIADRLGVSRASLRKRVQQARAALRQQLSAYFAGEVRWQEPSRNEAGSAIELHPWSVAAPVRLGFLKILLDSGRAKRCVLPLYAPAQRPTACRLTSLRAYVARHPLGWKKRLELARHLVLLGRCTEAVPHYRAVVRRQPRRVSIWLELAEVLRGLDCERESLEAWQDARNHARLEASERHVTGWLAGQGANLPAALSALTDAARLEPTNDAHPIALGRIYLQAGRAAKAVEAFDAALEIQSDNALARTLRHQAHRARVRSFGATPQRKRTPGTCCESGFESSAPTCHLANDERCGHS